MRRHASPLSDLRSVGITAADEFVRWTDPDRLLAEVRRRFIRDATLALVLVGDRTWTRRFIDWELAAAATAGCALLAFPLDGSTMAAPARLRLLAEEGAAVLRDRPPTDDHELRAWMQTARQAYRGADALGRAMGTPLMRHDAALSVR